MRTSIKKLAILMITLCLSVSSSIISFAGEWKQDDIGWWYVNDDGSYPINSRQEIDGKWYCFDGKGYLFSGWRYDKSNDKWYFFDTSGVMKTNMTYDIGYTGDDGAWTTTHKWVNAHTTTEEELDYWRGKWSQYGIENMEFIDNGDGTYSYSYQYDENMALPDVLQVLVSKALFLYSRFTFNFYSEISTHTVTLTISDTWGY